MKTTLKITSFLVCLFFLSVSSGLAKPGMNRGPDISPMWWHNQKLSKKLGITAEQQDNLENYLKINHPKMIDLKADAEKSLFALEGAFGKDFNEQEASAKIQAYLNAQNAIMTARMNTLLNTRKILTFEQFKNLRQESKKHRRNKLGSRQEGQQRPQQRRK